MSSVSRYVEKSRDEFKARPILPLGTPLRPGAVGVVENDQFSPRGTVASILGTRVGKVESGAAANWQATSGSDVGLRFVASGEASTIFPSAPKAGAKVEVTFGSSDSLLVSVGGVKVSRIADPAALIARMLDAFRRGTWRKEYVLVYEVMEPADVLVLLARQRDTKFLLSAKAKVKAPQGSADLAGKFELRYQSKDAVKLDSGRQPVFFNAYRVKERFFSENEVESFGPDAENPFEAV
jgi:hypothetical protein